MAKKYYQSGTIIHSNKWGSAEVLDVMPLHLFIKFLNTGYTTIIHKTAAAQGCFCDNQAKEDFKEALRMAKIEARNRRRFIPSVYGVGYLGIGPNNSYQREYTIWNAMMARCYSVEYSRRRNYDGCSVDPRWHNYQTFCEDIKHLTGYAEWLDPENDYELDKDIKVDGNRLYSPETCMFVSAEENFAHANARYWERRAQQFVAQRGGA